MGWVIASKPDDAIPEIGKLYEIRHSRKGIFYGKVVRVEGGWADVDVVEGKPKFISWDAKLSYDGQVTVRDSLVYLIEIEEG